MKKKIIAKMHCFGPWYDPDAALAKYLLEREFLQAERTPLIEGESQLR